MTTPYWVEAADRTFIVTVPRDQRPCGQWAWKQVVKVTGVGDDVDPVIRPVVVNGTVILDTPLAGRIVEIRKNMIIPLELPI